MMYLENLGLTAENEIEFITDLVKRLKESTDRK